MSENQENPQQAEGENVEAPKTAKRLKLDFQYLLIAQIVVNHPAKEERTFDRKKAEALAKSIDVEGLHHPVVVRPIPGQPGKYELISGRHRLYAVAKILGRTEIACFSRPDLTDRLAHMARLSENLYHNKLSQDQFYFSMTEWCKLYAEENPEADQKGKAGGKARGKQKQQQAAAKNGLAPALPAGEPEADPEPTPARTPEDDRLIKAGRKHAEDSESFAAHVAAMMGESASNARRSVQIAKFLATLERPVAEKILKSEANGECPAAQDLLELCKLHAGKNPDPALLKDVITLVCSGKTIKEALKDARAKRAKEAKAAGTEPIDADDDLSDADWLQMHLAKLLAELTSDRCREILKQDALLWKRLRPHTEKYRRAIRSVRNEALKTYKVMPFLRRIGYYLNVKHPKEWIACKVCGGNGHDKANGRPCTNCKGYGYIVQEEYPRA